MRHKQLLLLLGVLAVSVVLLAEATSVNSVRKRRRTGEDTFESVDSSDEEDDSNVSESEALREIQNNPRILPRESLMNIRDMFDGIDEGDDDLTPAPSGGGVGPVESELDLSKRKERPGKALHPVVVIPGIISTQLEAWESVGKNGLGQKCFGFRDALWTPKPSVLLDPLCTLALLRNFMLDPKTGLDPPGVRLRARKGLKGADYVTTSSKALGWLWAPLLKRLAKEGYDNNSVHIAGYDWRLSWKNLEDRDRYFTHLKEMIRSSVHDNGKKALIVTHSMGSVVWFYFMNWIADEGEPNFIRKHVHAWVNTGGALLGAPKTILNVATGEMGDFSFLSGTLADAQHPIFASWGSLHGLLPRGGNTLYKLDRGQGIFLSNKPHHEGVFAAFRKAQKPETVEYAYDDLKQFFSEENFAGNVFKRIRQQLNDHDYNFYSEPPEFPTPAMWDNPLAMPLPRGRHFKVYNFYGTRQETPLGFYFADNNEGEGSRKNVRLEMSRNKERDEDKGVKLIGGGLMGDGDASVPLVSLSFMGLCAWKKTGPGTHNPHGATIRTKEYEHDTNAFWSSVGREFNTKSAHHVDIIGHKDYLNDIARLARGEEVEEVVSDETMAYLRSLGSGLCPGEGGTHRKINDLFEE